MIKANPETMLADLMATAVQSHDEACAVGRKQLQLYIDVGTALLAARDVAPQDTWTDNLRANFCAVRRLSLETARVYMRIAEGKQKILDALDRNPDLTLEEAKRLVAKRGRNLGTQQPPIALYRKQLQQLAQHDLKWLPEEAIPILLDEWDKVRDYIWRRIGKALRQPAAAQAEIKTRRVKAARKQLGITHNGSPLPLHPDDEWDNDDEPTPTPAPRLSVIVQ